LLDAGSTEEFNNLSTQLFEVEKNLQHRQELMEDCQDQLSSISRKLDSLPQELDRLIRNLPNMDTSRFPRDLGELVDYANSRIRQLEDEGSRGSSQTSSVVFQAPRSQPDVTRHQGGWGFVGQLGIAPSVEISRVLSWQLGKKMLLPVVESEQSPAGRYCLEKDSTKLSLDLVHIDSAKITLPSEGVELPSNIVEEPKLAYRLLRAAPAIARESRNDVFDKVFANLFRNLIVMETYDQAYLYKKWVTQTLRRNCPTIVTLDGQLLTSNGITGGRHNRCPDNIDTLFTVESGGDREHQVRVQITALQNVISCAQDMLSTKEEQRRKRQELKQIQEEQDGLQRDADQLESQLRRLNPSFRREKNTISRRRRSAGSISGDSRSGLHEVEERPNKRVRTY
jgi:chromosome segregation ATPase